MTRRAVPPRTDRKERVADGQAVAVAGNSDFTDLVDPSRNLLAFGIAFVEIVVSRAKNDLGDPGQKRQIFLHHHDLGAKIDRRSDIERVTGEDHEVELRRCTQQPVELRQRVMQIGNDEAAHLVNQSECSGK